MGIGQELMAEFAAENKLLGFTDAQMLELSVALGDVQRLLGSGSLSLSKTAWDSITPITTILEQARIDKYSNVCQYFFYY